MGVTEKTDNCENKEMWREDSIMVERGILKVNGILGERINCGR